MNIPRIISYYVGNLSTSFSPINRFDSRDKLLIHFQGLVATMSDIREALRN